jgi:two-component system NtrC family sensor kinase
MTEHPQSMDRTGERNAPKTRRRKNQDFAALLAAAVLVPLLILGAAAWWSWLGVNDEARARLMRMADMLHEHALRTLDTQEAILEAIDRAMGDDSWGEIAASQELHALIAALNGRSPPSGGIVLVSPERYIVAGSGQFPFPPIDAHDRDYIVSENYDGDRVFIGETVIARPSGRRVFPVSRARHVADEAGGWIVASFRAEYFEDFYRTVMEDTNDAAALLRTDGAVLARTPTGLTLPDLGLRQGPAPVGPALSGEGPGVATTTRIVQGDDGRLYASRRVEGYPLAVIYGLSRDVIHRAWLRELLAHAAIAWLAAMALLFLTMRARRAARRERVALADAQFEAERRAEAETRLAHMQRVDALGRIVGGVAHDFNNIVQAMRGGAARVAKRADDPEEVRRIAGMIDAAAERGARLIERMLAFARRDQIPTAQFDPAQALSEIGDLLTRTIGSAHRLQMEIEPDLPAVAGDRSQFETALVNLVLNARDAMPDGGPIRLVAQREKAAAEVNTIEGGEIPTHIVAIAVADAGAGMDENTLARAGEPFFTTKPEGEGTGLGLATARAFAEGAGGSLEIASVEGAGARITLRLPTIDS